MPLMPMPMPMPMPKERMDEGAKVKTQEWVRDSVIMSKVKADPAAAKLSSPVKIQVEIDNADVVALSGTTAPGRLSRQDSVSGRGGY